MSPIEKQRLRNSSNLKESKEASYLNAMGHLGLDPGTEKILFLLL